MTSRLAIFLPSLNGGGAERCMLNLARGMTEKGHQVDLVLAQTKGPLLGEVPKSVRLVELLAGRTLASLPALVTYLRRERPEAMLSSLDHSNIVAVWARRLARAPVRVLVNEQNTMSSWAKRSPQLRRRVMPMAAKRFYPWADKVVAVSKGVADDLVQQVGIPESHVEVIYNPVVTPELEAKCAAPLDHPWFQRGQPPVLLGVGRLARQKDFPTLIQAFARVRRQIPARLMILGDGAERPVLEETIDRLGLEQDVSLPGFVDNPFPYLKRSSAFVLSSRWEGLPTVVIEALYCGVPVVATDCPSGPREILKGGRLGCLVPMGDVDGLARGMSEALSGNAPRPTADSWMPYHRDAVVDRYLESLLVA
jgi:glycosyltransferase involved in cell wall biosynthesis